MLQNSKEDRLKPVLLAAIYFGWQFGEAANNDIRLELPGIESALWIALHPSRAQAASPCADHVEWIARNEPDEISSRVQFLNKIFVDLSLIHISEPTRQAEI